MGYSIQLADLKRDQPEVLTIFRGSDLHIQEDRYAWLYDQSPLGPASCWLALHDGTAVGTCSLLPRRFLINGKICRAGVACNFGVTKEHRVLGPALMLQKATLAACDRRDFDLVYGFPNQAAQPVQLRAGYRLLGEATMFVKVLKSHSFLRKRLQGTNHRLVSALSRGVDTLQRYVSRERWYRRSADWKFEGLSRFDDRFDLLWKEAGQHYTAIAERTSAYLNWRFVSSPHRRFTIFALSNRKTDQVLGYIVSYEEKEEEGKVRIADVFTMGMAELDAVLSEFLLVQRRAGTPSVAFLFLGRSAVMEEFRRLGFVPRACQAKMLYYANTDCLPLLPAEQEKWYIVEGDSDF
ncbi:MAG: GNAT family N-acetyltransferase [Acidobacteriia bacterium]|nr:GNAT family N-acetyltransferase [Terriglobia bacterium]